MNKFIALLALVAAIGAVVSAAPSNFADDEIFAGEEMSQLAIFPENDDETAKLKPEAKLFRSFCIESRDKVKAFLKNSVNDATSRAFNVMFNAINDVSEATLEEQRRSTAEGAELISNSQVVDEAGPESAGLIASIKGAIGAVVRTVVEAVARETTRRVNNLKKEFKGDNVKEKITEACQGISYNLKNDLEKSFKATKSELSSEATTPEMVAFIAGAQLDDVGCVTAGRIATAARVCDILNLAGPTIYRLIGI